MSCFILEKYAFFCAKKNKQMSIFRYAKCFFFVEKRGSQQFVTKNRKGEKTTFSLDMPVPQDENTSGALNSAFTHM